MFLTTINSNPEPISAAEFAEKVSEAVIMLINSVSGIIMPIAILSLLISIILFIVGSFVRSSSVRKAGAGGIGAVILGLVIYYATPTIVALISGLQQIFE